MKIEIEFTILTKVGDFLLILKQYDVKDNGVDISFKSRGMDHFIEQTANQGVTLHTQDKIIYYPPHRIIKVVANEIN